MKVSVHEAKTHLSKLLKRVSAGERVTILRSGIPVAYLVPAQNTNVKRQLGVDRDSVTISEDFDASLPANILAHFE